MKFNFHFPALFLTGLFAAALNGWAASTYSVPYAFSTLAGDSSIGSSDGPGKVARFYAPRGVTIDRTGNVYVADAVNQTIRKITPDGVVSTLAGTAGIFGVGYGDPATRPPIDGTGPAAIFSNPEGIAADHAGNLYVTDKMAFLIRKVTPQGVVTTIAGAMSQQGSADGIGSAARFSVASAAAVDADDNLYVTEWINQTIRKITPAGVVTTIAGKAGISGSADGTGEDARFFQPMGIILDSKGTMYVTDTINCTIRKVTSTGVVTTIAGQAGVQGSADGPAGDARFNRPCGITLDSSGNLYIADTGNSTIRKMTADGVVTTVAGKAGVQGSADGQGTTARFRGPVSLTIDPVGVIYIADGADNTIRKLSPDGVVTTFAGLGLDYSFGNNDGVNARFNQLGTTAVGPDGTAYVADTFNATIRKITADGSVTTLAGKAGVRGHADGTGSDASFEQPYGITVDQSGTLFVTDPGNDTIRQITAAGVVTTLAGDAIAGPGYANGTGSTGRFAYPFGITIGADGALYVTDTNNAAIRRITLSGAVSTYVGPAKPGAPRLVDGEIATAHFVTLMGICADANGNLLVTDANDQTISRIMPTGLVSIVAGQSEEPGSADGDRSDARFSGPSGIAIDKSGTIYVADSGNQLIRQISPTGKVSTLGGLVGASGYANGLGVDSRFQSPPSVALNAATDKLYITSGATLRVGQAAGAVIISTQPQSASYKLGESAQFSVVASGVPTPTYQWFRGGSPIAGATTATFNLGNVQTSDAADYTVTVSNALGTATSNKATLTITVVTPAPVPNPTPANSGGNDAGSGGGAVGSDVVLALLGLAVVRIRGKNGRAKADARPSTSPSQNGFWRFRVR